MNWYKKASLVIKEGNTFVHCCYCHRWKTDDNSQPWKKYEELNPKEKETVDFIRASYMMWKPEDEEDRRAPITHGICTYCVNALHRLKSYDPDKIKELSLTMPSQIPEEVSENDVFVTA